MIEDGSPVKLIAREQSPSSLKYAGCVGYVMTTIPGVYETLCVVQLDVNASGVDTACEEEISWR